MDLYADLRTETEPILGANAHHSLSSINNMPSDTYSPATDTAIFQSAVFVEDGVNYRTIHHKIDPHSLRLYRIYYSRYIQWLLGFVIFVNLMLAFVEYPTSLTLSSDFRYKYCNKTHEPPCGVTETIEFVCLVFFLVDCITQFYLLGWRRFMTKPWLVLYAVMIVVSFVDLFVSFGFCLGGDRSHLGYSLRIRRFCRPLFFLLSSSIMKKYSKAIKLTLPQIFTVLVLLLLHIYVFTMIGLLAFPRPPQQGGGTNTTNTTNISTSSDVADRVDPCSIDYDHFSQEEGDKYFPTVTDALVNLLVLLTTANHPDVRMPIYQVNRFSAFYFIIFLLIGAYLILNLLIAVIYNQFKGFFQKSLQSSFFRRRVAFRAAFTVLARLRKLYRGQELVSKDLVRQLLQKAKIDQKLVPSMYQKLETMESDFLLWKDFRDVFDLVSRETHERSESELSRYSNYALQWIQVIIRHPYFAYFTYTVSVVHVLLITIELQYNYDYALGKPDSRIAYYNFFFVIYYVTEQIVKIVFLGRKQYLNSLGNIYEGLVTLTLLILEILVLSLTHSPFGSHQGFDASLYDVLIRIMNIGIVLRLLRVIPHVKSLSLLTGTIIDLVKNLRGFLGIIVVVYYLFALLGMELFMDVDRASTSLLDVPTNETQCGTYENLKYFANNFHDFAASLVVLWDVMVVNNWYVYLDKFARDSRFRDWSKLYFIAWWLVSVVICANLFVSLVLETFLIKWEAVHSHHGNRQEREPSRERFSVSASISLSTTEETRVCIITRVMLLSLYSVIHLVEKNRLYIEACAL